jgi:hypothetical protein
VFDSSRRLQHRRSPPVLFDFDAFSTHFGYSQTVKETLDYRPRLTRDAVHQTDGTHAVRPRMGLFPTNEQSGSLSGSAALLR